jgi:peptide/nickel transport system substrate-binding protein
MDVKADGKYTVVFTLNDANADFPYIISDDHLTIFPANQYPTKYAELPSL